MTTIFLPAGTTSWVVPADWNNAANTIECIGAGQSGTGNVGPGGKGGAYAKVSNQSVSGTLNTQVGAGNSANDTWWNTTGTVLAQCGVNGGSAASSVGATKFNGGSGGASGTSAGGGGGGGAGPSGAGVNGANSTVSATGGNGGAGGNGSGGAGGTSPGAGQSGGRGSDGTEYDATHGSGGGGAGGGGIQGGGDGGNYGAGGGGGGGGSAAGGAGTAGLIIITYTPSVVTTKFLSLLDCGT